MAPGSKYFERFAMDLVGVGLTICGITVPTGGVIITALLRRRNNNSNPRNVSERVCASRQSEIATKIEGMKENIELKLINLQEDINEIKGKV